MDNKLDHSYANKYALTKIFDYSNEILDIIDHRDDYPRGDLQGIVEALVMKMLKDKL